MSFKKSEIRFDREIGDAEIGIKKSGNINALQRRRYGSYLANFSTDPIGKFLRTEERLRHIFQKELSLRQEAKKPENKEVQEQLRALNKEFWKGMRQWWGHRNQLSCGVVSRAFNLWRSNRRWYMHRVLVDDCARKQGCCSRGCGCCVDRPVHKDRLSAVGHCTLECGCCRKARGFELTQEEQTEIYENMDNGYENEQIQLASIWGIQLNCHDSPFDLIIDAPRYDQPPEYDLDESGN